MEDDGKRVLLELRDRVGVYTFGNLKLHPLTNTVSQHLLRAPPDVKRLIETDLLEDRWTR